jgi:7,8-dihydropterin-6-yl-methyl-4-(beta-D-ribofuranosyl)aminobenzene 5'-phosphate synthase
MPTSLPPVDRVTVTTVVDNSVDLLRADEKVARRWTVLRARKFSDLRAEHGLAHHVEVARGRESLRIAFDFGLTAETMTHNFRELGIDAGAIDVLALSHGHVDHFGGLLGFLYSYRRAMRPRLQFYGHPNHYLARFMEREGTRVFTGRLDRADLARWDLDLIDAPEPTTLDEGVLLSGEMRTPEPYETIPPSLRMEENSAVVQDTFIGEQTLVANVRDRGLVVVTSCSHRGIVGICRHATRVSGVSKIHAVIGGFHLSGLDAERIDRVVEALRGFEVDYLVPQHCTGAEAFVRFAQRMGKELVVSSTGSTFTFGG